MNVKRLMVIAGGTGGHVFPGIAIADQLIKQGWKIRWLGTPNHIEADLVPKYGIDIEFIYINSLRGRGIKAFLLAIPNILNALYQAYRIIKKWQPDIVLGMGGYVAGPGSLAAWSCGIPVILHEQNRIAGLTNKWLAKIATKVLQAFPGALPQAKVVGNPVRTDVLDLPLTIERFNGRTGPMRILVIGGSQGAQIFNQIFPKVAVELEDLITLWHQTGKEDKETVQQAYRTIGQLQHKVTKFIDNIAEAYAWADIVVCRAGALTVSELAVAGLPAIFVPFQHKDRQQYWNALLLQKIGAAKILEQQNFNVVTVTEILRQLDRITLLGMAKKARQIATLDSTDKIVQVIISIVQ